MNYKKAGEDMQKNIKPMKENALIGILSELLAIECGYSPKEARQIRIAAVLHDVGKKFIPEHIKNKPDKLNAAEYEIMKTHTKLGAEMLSSLCGDLGEMARTIAMYHHEVWQDGGGYWGVPSYTLPHYVGIVSICDVFVALISTERLYKEPWSKEDAIKFIKSQAGTKFCPILADIFVSMIRSNGNMPANIFC